MESQGEENKQTKHQNKLKQTHKTPNNSFNNETYYLFFFFFHFFCSKRKCNTDMEHLISLSNFSYSSSCQPLQWEESTALQNVFSMLEIDRKLEVFLQVQINKKQVAIQIK